MSNKTNEIIDTISKMNILEIVELTKEIEKKFDISSNMITPNTNTSSDNEDKPKKETAKTEFAIIMTNFGDSKLNVIKTIRTMLNLGLKEAKEFVENLPATIKENVQKDEAEDIKNKLENCGAKIELK